MQRKKRRQFSWEFKVEAVRLMTEGKRSMLQVARELDLKPDQLRAWRKQIAPQVPRPAETDAQELARLRRELARTQEELEFLKKAAAYFASRPR
jgi:transposase